MPTTFYAATVQLLRAEYGSAGGACKVTEYAAKAMAAARDIDEVLVEAQQLNADDRWTVGPRADQLRTKLLSLAELALGYCPTLPCLPF